MATIHFGKNTSCSSIEVEPFTPICTYPDVDPSTPLTLDVPVPAFVNPLPPNECACFTFVKSESKTVVITDCTQQETAKTSVEIAPLDTDCCTGRYAISSHVEIPCMPFDVVTEPTNVHNRSGIASRGIDGSASLTVAKGTCCTLNTELEVVLPDCIKGFVPPVANQVTYCRREADGTQGTHTHQLIEMVADADNCSLYPTVNPIELPCCTLPDGLLDSGSFALDARGSTASWSLTRTDCDVKLAIDTDIRDCHCLSFETGITPVTTTTCNMPGQISVEISQVPGSTCCEPQFAVTPHIEIPCMPFTINTPEVSVSNTSGNLSRGIDGSAEMTLEQGTCCEIVSGINIKFPDCIKEHDEMTNPDQIKYCDHGVPKAARILEIKQDADNCTFYPVFHPLEIPCCPFADEYLSGTFPIDNGRGSVNWRYAYEDCKPSFTFSAIPACPIPDFSNAGSFACGAWGTINWAYSWQNCAPSLAFDADFRCPLPDVHYTGTSALTTNCGGSVTWDYVVSNCSSVLNIAVTPATIPTFPNIPTYDVCSSGADLTIKYTGDDGTEKTLDPKPKVTLTKTAKTGGFELCCSIEDINLTGIGGTFNNNGDVFRAGGGGGGGGGGGSKSLWIDARPEEGVDTWYGGGYGNRDDNQEYDTTFCRGPGMRNDTDISEEINKTCVMLAELSGRQQLMKDAVTANGRSLWLGAQLGSDATGAPARNLPTEQIIKGKPTPCASGNLSLVIPSGFQWHPHGLATVISHLFFNPSGVLCREEEYKAAVLISPAPARMLAQRSGGVGTGTGPHAIAADLNASGLGIFPTDLGTAGQLTTVGLSVKEGHGLRIYNIGDGRTPTDDTDDQVNRQGALEVHYGYGLHVTKWEAGTKTHESKPSEANGALEINFGSGIRAVTELDADNKPKAWEYRASNSVGALEINYGNGLRAVTKVDSDGNPTDWATGTSTVGSIEPNYGLGFHAVKTVNPLSYSPTITTHELGAVEINCGRGLNLNTSAVVSRSGRVEVNADPVDFMMMPDSNNDETTARICTNDSYDLNTVNSLATDFWEVIGSIGNKKIHHTYTQQWTRRLGVGNNNQEIIVPFMIGFDVQNKLPVFAYMRLLINGTILGIYTKEYHDSEDPVLSRISGGSIKPLS